MQWEKDQIYLINAIPDYRKVIDGKELTEARKLTKMFAENLHSNTENLHHRSAQSINERLPYLDNLLAGALEKENYAQKDQHLYFTHSRPNGSREFNRCNTRHSYNRTVRE